LIDLCAFLLLQLVTFLNSPLVRLQYLEHLILDEKSMIGVRLFSYVDRRMRQIFENDLSFGGRNIILLGDFH
jgi:hypothetical protein